MRVLDLAFKDLTQIARDWKSALFLVIMPILFTLFFGFILGPQLVSDAAGGSRLPIGIVNHDADDVIAGSLMDLLEGSSVIRPLELTDEQATRAGRLVADGELAAVLTIPAGYGAGLMGDDAPPLELIADEMTPAGQAAAQAVETGLNRLRGALETAHISAESYATRVGFTDQAARQAHVEEALAAAVSAWADPPLAVRVEMATGAAESEGAAAPMSGFVQSSPGMIVQFAIFGLITSAMVLVMERKSRALQRLLATPISRPQIIAGHTLAMFGVVFLQETILVLVGQFAFGVDYLRQPLAVLLVMVGLALWAASLGLLIGAASKTEDQVIVLSLVAMFVFAAMGGAWFPLEVTGKTFAAIGHLMPSAWAIDGLQNIIVRGLGLGSVLLPAGILLAYATLFFGLAVWRFRFE